MALLWIPLIATALLCPDFVACEAGEDPPRIETFPQDQTVASGGIAVFVCTAVGNPNPQIEWLKNGKKRVTTQRYTVRDMPSGSVLRIEPVREGRDDATYECVAENGVGEPVRAFADLNLLPEDQLPEGFPKFVREPTTQAIEKGRNALLLCQVEGDPEPTVKWLKNMIPLDMTVPRYSLVQGYSLQIRDAEEDDEGNYECMAENSHGSALSVMATLYVRVRRVLPYFSIRPENLYEVMPGSSLNITCVAVGSPMPFVKWRKGLMDITPDHSIPVGRNVLVLTDISESANYSCIAASELGSIETVTQVVVQVSPRPPTNVVISHLNSTSVRLSWSYNIVSENISYYIIRYKPKQAEKEYSEFSGITSMFFTVRRLNPRTEYEFHVIAVDGNRRLSPSALVVATTGETDVPTQLGARDVTTHSMTLSWRRPSKMDPMKYKISYGAYKEFYDSQGNLQKLRIPTHIVFVNADVTEYYVTNLMPFTSYRVNITAVPGDESFRPPAKITVTTAMAAPMPMVKPVFFGVKSGSEIAVILPKASEEFGPISHYFLMVVPEEEAYKDPSHFTTDELSLTPSDEGGPYIAAKFLHRSIPELFFLGDGQIYRGFVNRRLFHDQKYRIFVRAVVDTHRKHLYTSSPFSDPLCLDMAPIRDPVPISEPGFRDRNDHPDMSDMNSHIDEGQINRIVGPVMDLIFVVFSATAFSW